MNHKDIYSESLLYQKYAIALKIAITMNTCYSQICILEHHIQNKMHFLWISYYKGITNYCARPKLRVKQEVGKLELNIPMKNWHR
jgi:hypothetical protein